MELIDIEKLGVVVTEYKEGVPFSSVVIPMSAIREVAYKVNELILLTTDNQQEND